MVYWGDIPSVGYSGYIHGIFVISLEYPLGIFRGNVLSLHIAVKESDKTASEENGHMGR